MAQENYQPVIVGVKHLIDHITQAKEVLSTHCLNNKTVLIEARPYSRIELIKCRDSSTTKFWSSIINYLEEAGVRIRYFKEGEDVARKANQRYENWVKSQHFPEIEEDCGKSLVKKFDNFLDIYAEEFNPVFLSIILKERPDMIIAGSQGHAHPLYSKLIAEGFKPKYIQIPS